MEHSTLETADEGRVAVVVADREDLPSLLGVQHRAFTRVALSFGIDPQVMPPASESLATLQTLFDDGTTFLIAIDSDGSIVGTVRAAEDPERPGAIEIGRLAVEDGVEGRGIGAALMRAVESAFPQAERYVLFTGAAAVGPLHLYDKLGYTATRSEVYEGRFELVWLEKPGNGAEAAG